MKAYVNVFTGILFPVLILFSLQGCTLIGGLIGSQTRILEEMESDESSFAVGTEVEVTLDRERRINGVYEGSDFMDDENYSPVYESSARALLPDHQLPGLNKNMTVRIRPDSSTQTILFRGFSGYRTYNLLGTETGSGRTWVMPLENVLQTVDSERNAVSRGSYSILAARHMLPLRTRIVVNTARGTEYFDSGRISSITRKKGTRLVTGMLIGLAIDALAVATFALNWKGVGWGWR